MDSGKIPLRVRAWLRSPVVADAWLPLDGVLLYQHTRAGIGDRPATLAGASRLAQPKGGTMLGGRLPLAYVHGKEWYYKCSWAQWGPHADGQDAWSKRIDQTLAYLVDFGGKRGRVDTSAGAYRAYRMPVYYRSALWVEWYCVGDPQQLGELLRAATHLGKKVVQGWGRVIHWDIEPISADYSIWRDGMLMRGVPVYDLPKGITPGRVGLYGIRPPYWDNRNQVELALP